MLMHVNCVPMLTKMKYVDIQFSIYSLDPEKNAILITVLRQTIFSLTICFIKKTSTNGMKQVSLDLSWNIFL